MKLAELLAVAHTLIEESNLTDNPEYVRGICEFIMNASDCPFMPEDIPTIEKMILAT